MASKLMPQNEATWDRVVRVLIGVALIALVFVGPQTACFLWQRDWRAPVPGTGCSV
jgi:hypothetical protein